MSKKAMWHVNLQCMICGYPLLELFRGMFIISVFALIVLRKVLQVQITSAQHTEILTLATETPIFMLALHHED